MNMDCYAWKVPEGCYEQALTEQPCSANWWWIAAAIAAGLLLFSGGKKITKRTARARRK